MEIKFLNFKPHKNDELFIEEELKRFSTSLDIPNDGHLGFKFSFEKGIFLMESSIFLDNKNISYKMTGRDPKVLASSSIIELKMSLLRYSKSKQFKDDLMPIAV